MAEERKKELEKKNKLEVKEEADPSEIKTSEKKSVKAEMDPEAKTDSSKLDTETKKTINNVLEPEAKEDFSKQSTKTDKSEEKSELESEAKKVSSKQSTETDKFKKEKSKEQSASKEKLRSSSREGGASKTGSAESADSKEDTGEEDFDSLFIKFAQFGSREDEDINMRSVDKWFDQANLFDDNLNSTDIAITFTEKAKKRGKLSKEEFEGLLEELAESKGMKVEEIKGKLASSGKPAYTPLPPSPKQSKESADSDEELGEDDFDSLFIRFAKFGDRRDKDINLRSVEKWFDQAELFDDNLSSTDITMTFMENARMKGKLTKEEFEKMLEKLAEDKGMELEEIKGKLGSCGKPAFTGATKFEAGTGAAAEAMRRLTDTSGFTGTHRERFDDEGHGKGLAGRYDSVENDGYVKGYKKSSEEKNYDKKGSEEKNSDKKSSDEKNNDKKSSEEKNNDKENQT